MYGICTCKHVDLYTSCILCFQSGGGGATSSGTGIGALVVSAFSAERLVVPGGHQVNQPGEVEIVSKTCVYFGMKRSVVELLVVRGYVKVITPHFFCIVTMISGTINFGTGTTH